MTNKTLFPLAATMFALISTEVIAAGKDGLPIRADVEPYQDLDPVFESGKNGSKAPWMGKEAERKEMQGMAASTAETVRDRLAARQKWYEEYQGQSACKENKASKLTAEQREAIYERNFGARSDPKPILSGRAVHFKSVGCFLADVSVSAKGKTDQNGVPLDRGIFAGDEHHYQAIVRFSNGSPRLASDSEPAGYGMAVKLLGQRESASDPYDFTDASAKNAKRLNDEDTVLNMSNIDFVSTFMYNPPQYRRVVKKFGEVLDAEGGCPTPGRDSDYKKQSFSLLGIEALNGNTDSALDLRTIAMMFGSKGHLPKNPLLNDYDSLSAFRLGENDGNQTAVKYLFQNANCAGIEVQDAEEGFKRSRAEKLNSEIHPLFTLDEAAVFSRLKRLAWGATDATPEEIFRTFGAAAPLDGGDKEQGPVATAPPKDFLRQSAERLLASGPVCFSWKLHPFLDEQNTPTDDATVTWMRSQPHRKAITDFWAQFNKETGVASAVDFAKGLAQTASPAEGVFGAISDRVPVIPKILKAPKGTFESMKGAVSGLPASVSGPAPMDQRAFSTPVEVGEIKLRKLGESNRIAAELCEQLSFSVWDRVPLAHKPIGRVNRMRWFAYRASREGRAAGVPDRLD